MGFEELVKTLYNEDFEILKKEFPVNWNYLKKKITYPYEFFNGFDDHQKSVIIIEIENFFIE